MLNKHQAKLTNSNLTEARIYFDKISKPTRSTSVRKVYEQSIIDASKQIRTRIYRDTVKPAASMIYFHGGGWVLGSIESHDEVARRLCKATGLAVISVGYSLAPEHPYPTAINEGMSVLKWLKHTQTTLPADKVFLAGDSAGGQIALQLALKADTTYSDSIKGLILMYPALDPSLGTESMQKYATRHFVSKDNMQEFWSAYLPTPNYPWPLSEDKLSVLPPTIIIGTEYDVLKDEGELFAEQLRRAHVQTTYIRYTNSVHGLLQLPSLVSGRQRVLQDISNFVIKQLG